MWRRRRREGGAPATRRDRAAPASRYAALAIRQLCVVGKSRAGATRLYREGRGRMVNRIPVG